MAAAAGRPEAARPQGACRGSAQRRDLARGGGAGLWDGRGVGVMAVSLPVGSLSCQRRAPGEWWCPRASLARQRESARPPAVPAFSGPGRGPAPSVAKECLVKTALGTPAGRRPRIGPAPTTAVLHHARPCRHVPRQYQGRGSGVRAQARFAVSWMPASLVGVDEAIAADPVLASRGRRTPPGPPARARRRQAGAGSHGAKSAVRPHRGPTRDPRRVCALRRRARRPLAAALDEVRVPARAVRRTGDLGFFGMRYPGRGRQRRQARVLAGAFEEVARGSMSLAGAAAIRSLMGTKFCRCWAAPTSSKRLLSSRRCGEKIGAICMTEPERRVRPRRDHDDGEEDRRRLRPQRAQDLDHVGAGGGLLHRVRQGGRRRSDDLPRRARLQGFAVGRAIHKMGVGAADLGAGLRGLLRPDTHRLSREEGDGEGAPAQDAGRDPDHHRRDGARHRAGGARGDAMPERKQFGKPIDRHQAIQFQLVFRRDGDRPRGGLFWCERAW